MSFELWIITDKESYVVGEYDSSHSWRIGTVRLDKNFAIQIVQSHNDRLEIIKDGKIVFSGPSDKFFIIDKV